MTEVRPLQPADVEAADLVSWEALRAMAVQFEPGGTPWPDREPDAVTRAQYRVLHLQRTDPAGAWAAVSGDDLVGVALSLRRGPMWFLSLLAVDSAKQSQGVGKALLDAALRTAEGAGAAWILATADPKALRRYALAGFAPHPGYEARGALDRSLLPAGLAVREGDWTRDAGLVDDVVTDLRGAPYGPDLEAMATTGQQLLVAESGNERGFLVLRAGSVSCLGATAFPLAQTLLWEALARAEKPEVTVDWLTADQQWAIDVALAARLQLLPGPSSCRRSSLGPLTPYLPSGAYG